jgi:hypothetical protein
VKWTTAGGWGIRLNSTAVFCVPLSILITSPEVASRLESEVDIFQRPGAHCRNLKYLQDILPGFTIRWMDGYNVIDT